MKCFLFSGKQRDLPDICGAGIMDDLLIHLRSCGITEIFSDYPLKMDGVHRSDFISAKKHLGTDWLAVYGGYITRQSPRQLQKLSMKTGNTVSLACSSKPWEHTLVLTDGNGFITKTERNPSPENAETNLCFSGMVWVATDDFDPGDCLSGKKTRAVLLSGYWSRPTGRENYLLAVHDILSGRVNPWPHTKIPGNGHYLLSPVPADTKIAGTLWVGRNCVVEKDCSFENCVLLDGARVGRGSRLRNCLIESGAYIPEGTELTQKYLSILGANNDREY